MQIQRVACFTLLALLWNVLGGNSVYGADKEIAKSVGSAARIISIRRSGNQEIVQAWVPAGNNQVTLEARASNGRTWAPLSVKRVAGKGGSVTLTAPAPQRQADLRVWVEPPPLPSAFYRGKSAFPALSGNSLALSPLAGAANALTPTAGASTLTSSSSQNTVTESDIWQINGNRLYFFNQYRGLQVIDITSPDAPVLVGQLDLAAAGEQMYVLDASHVVLLAEDCAGGNTDLEVVNVSGNQPVIETNFIASGYMQNSLFVGSALYLVSEGYNNTTTNAQWGTVVTSFDFAHPSAPVARDSLWLPSSSGLEAASGNYLFVAAQDATNWWESDLNCIDISAGDGSMNDAAVIQTAGTILSQDGQNASGIQLSGNVLSVVSETYSETNGAEGTTVDTFSLANPAAPAALGSLQLAAGDYLSASVFSGSLLYISAGDVTNPLYVVDLSDPAAPQVAGTIDVPGTASFIYPIGNQLVTIGQGSATNWQTTVSLFDVSNPAHPALLSQVGVGDTNSWSEATYDSQAFTLLPASGLILVPYDSYTAAGDISGVQLIDLGPTSLAARGVIAQAQARRATLFQNRLISISGGSYLSANISNQDSPVATGYLTLAWPVDSVFIARQYLLEVGGSNFDQPDTVVRVAAVNAPDVLLAQWALTNGSILGAVAQGDLLYVLEGTAPQSPLILDPVLGPVTVGTARLRAAKPRRLDGASSNSSSLTLSIIDTSQLPSLAIVGETTLATTNPPSGNVQAVWVEPNVLAWVDSGQKGWFWPLLSTPANGGAPIVYPSSGFWGARGVQVWTFDVSQSDAPALDAAITIAPSGWSDGGAVVAANGLLYLSHSQWSLGPIPAIVPLNSTISNLAPAGNSLKRAPAQRGNTVLAPSVPAYFNWSQGSFLDVVDFTVPTAPVVRAPVNIAGPLAGVSRGGNVLYVVGTGANWEQYLDALAYDGVSAYYIANLPLGGSWNATPLVWNETLFAGQSATDGSTNWLRAWTLTDAATFRFLGSTGLSSPVGSLAAFGALLSAQSGAEILLFDASKPTALRTIGGGSPPGCLWPGLSGADGSLTEGLWSPLGAYGVFFVPAGP